MSLAIGSRLGPYEVLAPLGAGGMGEVYRARDTRLDRTVAIKVLPSHLSDDLARRQRFEREARSISALSHPHICTLHDIGRQDGIDYLVMEYLEGETLADRLSHGALKTELVLRYAVQIADALYKAHRQGFVHRDLKPGNIMLTRTGVKLLDFGLAKLAADETPVQAGANLDAAATRTVQQPLTAEGTIAGTLQYMAPEQLEGKEADLRTDIFAFGAVVYEMATGRKAFEGNSQASLIAAILAAEPKPMLSLQPLAPPALDRVVQTCLAKDPEERWQNAHDMMRELQWIAEAKLQPAEARRGPLSWERFWIAGSAFFLLAALGLATLYFRLQRGPAEVSATYLSLLPPEKGTFFTLATTRGGYALSPDGRRLAMVAFSGGNSRLWLQSFDSPTPRPLTGTEGAFYPFWSPDSRFIGFFTQGKLKKIEVVGGSATTVCDAPSGRGGTWNRDGVILFTPSLLRAIYRVSDTGGVAKAVTTLDESRQEQTHYFPNFLPDGRHFFYLAQSGQPELRTLCVGSLDGEQTRRLVRADSSGAYVAPQSVGPQTGYFLFVRARKLLVQPFDMQKLQISGDSIPLVEPLPYSPGARYAEMTVSNNGVLAYRSPCNLNRELVWCDRRGNQLSRVGTLAEHATLELSPNGKQVALERNDPQTETSDIWLLDLSRDMDNRLTSDPGWEARPLFSPDGSHIVYGKETREARWGIYRAAVGEGNKQEPLLKTTDFLVPTCWSMDGRFVVYTQVDPKAQSDLWFLPLFGDRQPKRYLTSDFSEFQGKLSPDGKWMAYVSDESGRYEVYVRSFPVPGEAVRVSKGGGTHPRWRRNGEELFYYAADGRLMAVAVKSGSHFEVGPATTLFEIGEFGGSLSSINVYAYDVTDDGQRFLVLKPVEQNPCQAITVALNWTAGLKR